MIKVMERPKIENYSLNKGVNIRDYISDLNLYIDQLKSENKKLKEASSILNTIGKDTPCPVCNNKMSYKPRLYNCAHCGSDFN